MIEPGQSGKLMLIFGVGYLAVFSVSCCFICVLTENGTVGLTRLETLRNCQQEYMLHCGIAIVSIASVLLGGPRTASAAGLIYT